MRFIGTLLQAVIGLAIVAAAWWFASSMELRTGSLALPGPEPVARKALELLNAGAFQEHVWASLTALLYGLAPALAAGILIGSLSGASGGVRWVLFGPVTMVLAAAPLVVLLPLLVLWLGLDLTPKVVLVFLVGTFSTANTIMALWPKRPALALVSPGAPKVSRPGPSPAHAIFAGLRIGVILGVTALVVGELALTKTGLGSFVVMSGSMFNTTDALAAALVIILPTVAVGVLLQAIEEQLAA
jgi:ABC-type nitrate/sulfonate/bicarbonate transport system permease component